MSFIDNIVSQFSRVGGAAPRTHNGITFRHRVRQINHVSTYCTGSFSCTPGIPNLPPCFQTLPSLFVSTSLIPTCPLCEVSAIDCVVSRCVFKRVYVCPCGYVRANVQCAMRESLCVRVHACVLRCIRACEYCACDLCVHQLGGMGQ